MGRLRLVPAFAAFLSMFRSGLHFTILFGFFSIAVFRVVGLGKFLLEVGHVLNRVVADHDPLSISEDDGLH